MVGHGRTRPYRKTQEVELVGSASEVEVYIEGIKVPALLDTGSTVSTVNESFYKRCLSHLELHEIKELINIECADGQPLPYFGFIEASIYSGGIPELDKDTTPMYFPILVVPESNYNNSVPLLIGTNVLHHLLEGVKGSYGERFLQQADLHTPWYLAFRSLTLREKELARNNNRLGLVKSAAIKPVVIPPNTSITIPGYIDRAIPYGSTPAILQSTSGSIIPADLEITPSVTDYNYPVRNLVEVHIDNVTTRTVQIPPKALLCEIQPVNIEDTGVSSTHTDVPPRKELLDLVTIDEEYLTPEELEISRNIIQQNEDVFSRSDTDIGHTNIATHHIELSDEMPFKQRPRNIPPSMYAEVKEHLQGLLDGNIIRKSRSPWSSNVVLCRKKNNELRMCVDYRQLNLRTKKDSYSLPRTEDILNALSRNKYFTILDMKSGYHQIEMHETHKERTAFTVGPLGFYEFNRMPFGLVNAPATYQRLMEECFCGLHLDICYIYLDDLIIFSKTFEEHMDRLRKIFQRLREVNLKLSPKKCEFFKRKVRYVGHIVSSEGIEPDPQKVDKVKDWPTPTNPDEVRQFLGFVGYYRRFIKDFSKISRPLAELVPEPTRKARRKSKNSIVPDKWEWGDVQQAAFDDLKQQLISFPILGFPEYNQPFELHTDASTKGLGAVLYQDQGGVKRVIAYASRSLSRSEKNYAVHKLEFLALKWAITEKFYDYLYGNNFIVFTDNNPLTYVLSSAKLDATGQRWISSLAEFNFTISYRPGLKNGDADSLSRIPGTIEAHETISTDSIKSICNVISIPYVECLAINTDSIDGTYHPSLDDIPDINIREQQWKDPVTRYWLGCTRDSYKPHRNNLPLHQQQAHAVFHRNFDRLRIVKGVLVREIVIEKEKKNQIILPASCVNVALQYIHCGMGHPGRDKTLAMTRDRFYWPNMNADVDHFIKNCKRCLLRKTPTTERAPLTSIHTYQPLELLCVDYLTLEPCKGGTQNILVITDHFTKYAQAIPTKNQTAKTTAEALFKNFIVHYGIPTTLHSDQGQQFESHIIQELCKLLNIKKSRTTPYHPMGNGTTERFNRTLLKMLGTLENDMKSDWKSHIPALVHAYNSMPQETTGYSPYFLMFGREPRLPVDVAFGLDTGNRTSKTRYIEELRGRLQKSYDLAIKSSAKAKDRQKQHYDLRTRGARIEEGDRVLVKIVAFDGKHKIADRWEEDPYIVKKIPNPEIPVYVVKKENDQGRERTLHRNLLLPIGHVDSFKPVPTPRQRSTHQSSSSHTQQKPSVTTRASSARDQVDTDSDSDDESFIAVEIVTVHNQPAPAQNSDTQRSGDEDVVSHGTDDGQLPIATTQGSEHDGDAHSSDTEPGTDGSGHADHAQPGVQSDHTDRIADTDATPEQAHGEVHDDDDDPDDDVAEDDVAEDDLDDVTVQLRTRKSKRVSKKPKWMKSGEYLMQQQGTRQSEWKAKAEYLRSLVAADDFKSMDTSVSSALINIIMEK